MLAIGRADGTLTLLDLENAQIRHTIHTHTGPISALAICTVDEHLLVFSAGDDAVIRVHDLETDEPTGELEGRDDFINALTDLGEGMIANGSTDGTIRIWRTSDGTPLGPPLHTGEDKMFNAVIDSLGDAGRLKDYYGAPARIERADKRHNFALGARLLTAATDRLTFTAGRSKPEQSLSTFDALTGVVSAADVLEILRGLRWHPDYRDEVIAPTLRFYDRLASDGRLEDFIVVWPQLVRRVGTRNLPGVGDGQVVTRSRRTPPRLDFVGSDSKHRDALERIAGASDLTVPDTVADGLRDNAGRRGAILLYVTGDLAAKKAEERATRPDELGAEPDGADLVVLLSMVAPAAATPSGQAFIDWTVRRHAGWGSATVNST